MLKNIQADELLLFFQATNYSWNVTGPRFTELRGLFCSLAKDILDNINSTAIEIRKLGFRAIGANFNEIEKLGRVPRVDEGAWPEDTSMIRNLLCAQEHLIQNLQQDREKVLNNYKDAVVEDYIIELIKNHREHAWKLRSHLEVMKDVVEGETSTGKSEVGERR